MRKDVPNSRPIAVDAGNAVDWCHPDNTGLVYLMGGYAGTHGAGGIVTNLVGSIPATMSLRTTARWSNAIAGQGGLLCSATSDGAEVATPARLQLALPITIACTVRSIGTPIASASIFGIAHNNANSTPFLSACIGLNGGSQIQYQCNSAGTFAGVASARTLASFTSPARIVCVHTAASVLIYINGVLDTSSVSARSNPTYGATSLLSIGNFTGISRNTNAAIWGGRIHNFAVDANWVRRDYQDSLTPWQDDRLRWFSTRSYSLPGGTTDGVGSASGTCTVSGVGASLVASVASASGSCTVAAVGAASSASVASASGTSTVSGVGTSAGTGSGAGTATGTSTASAVGAAAIASIFSAVGTCTVNGISPSGLTEDGRSVTGVAMGTRTATGVAMGSRSVTGRGPN
jgi:hypothetical protein